MPVVGDRAALERAPSVLRVPHPERRSESGREEVLAEGEEQAFNEIWVSQRDIAITHCLRYA